MSIATYFFQEEPKQLFVGADLCARGYLWLRGGVEPKTWMRVIEYAQAAQDVFAWPNCGRALTELAREITVFTFAEAVSQAALCTDVAFKYILPSQNKHSERLKGVVLAADFVSDASELKRLWGMTKDTDSTSYKISLYKTILSLYSTVLYAAMWSGVIRCKLSRSILATESVLLIAKVANHYFKDKS